MIYATLQKQAAATLDFAVSYATWLGDDTVAVSEWDVPSGLTGSDEDIDETAKITTIMLSGGTRNDVPYEVVNTVTTTGGRTEKRTLRIIVPTDEFLAAYEELYGLVQPTTDPVLTESEVNAALLKYPSAKVWAAGTSYNYGDVIVPSVRNGHRYRVTVAGTSGSTEPSWGLGIGSNVTDNTLTLEEVGLQVPLWDVYAAASYLWTRKRAKAAERYDYSNAGNNRSVSQLMKHCKEMADSFRVPQIA